MKKILFVCHGNICRSPMTEFVMKDLVKKAGLVSEFHIESAATSREEIGHFPYRPRLVLKGVGEIPAAKVLPSAASACIIDKDPGQVPQGAPDSKGQPPCLKGAAK